MDIREKIEKSLEKIIFGLTQENIDSELTLTQDMAFGDYTTNIALRISKKLNIRPRDLAEEIRQKVNESEILKEDIDRIEVAGAGFINFYLSDKYLSKVLNEPEFEQKGRKEKVVVEFGDPNPFKQIHIGHLRNFCIGESFSRLLESQGAEVVRANYQGDVGMHVAKALYGLIKQDISEFNAKILSEAYAYGATEFENSEDAKKEIQRLNKLVYEESEEIKDIWEKGRQISLDSFEKIYEKIGVKYDKYYFESETAKEGKKIVLSHIDDGIFEKDDGAVIYRGEKDGLHTRVFLTREEYATYEAKDLALAVMKDNDLSYDKSIILTGNEQAEYFQVMLAALNKISPELSEKTTHLTFGHVRLKEGKMSSRTGDVITAEWLLEEALKKIQENFKEVDSATSEKISIGAVKYSMLKFGISSDIHFDFNESISLEGNSGPYIQYTYVRTKSVLDKTSLNSDQVNIENLEKEENELLRYLSFYPLYVEKAANEFAPNVLCMYLFELCQKYNLFYQKHKIIGSEKEAMRIRITQVTGQIIKNGLNLLGIETVDKM